MVKKLYKDGCKKAVTLSFDDGTDHDMRLVLLLNKYNLKATFNFIAHGCANHSYLVKVDGKNCWDDCDSLREFFKGHEIANHSATHPHLEKIDEALWETEIKEAGDSLSAAIGYKVRGFALPYGSYNEKVIDYLRNAGFVYNRTCHANRTFDLPEDFLLWAASGHFADFVKDEGQKMIDDFLATDKELALFYAWGHSFELSDMDCYSKDYWCGITKRWDAIEEMLFSRIAQKDDIWYANNIEICDYVTAMRRAEITDSYINNPTDTCLFFELDGEAVAVAPNSKVEF